MSKRVGTSVYCGPVQVFQLIFELKTRPQKRRTVIGLTLFTNLLKYFQNENNINYLTTPVDATILDDQRKNQSDLFTRSSKLNRILFHTLLQAP